MCMSEMNENNKGGGMALSFSAPFPRPAFHFYCEGTIRLIADRTSLAVQRAIEAARTAPLCRLCGSPVLAGQSSCVACVASSTPPAVPRAAAEEQE